MFRYLLIIFYQCFIILCLNVFLKFLARLYSLPFFEKLHSIINHGFLALGNFGSPIPSFPMLRNFHSYDYDLSVILYLVRKLTNLDLFNRNDDIVYIIIKKVQNLFPWWWKILFLHKFKRIITW